MRAHFKVLAFFFMQVSITPFIKIGGKFISASNVVLGDIFRFTDVGNPVNLTTISQFDTHL